MATSDSQFVCPLNQFAGRYASAGLPVYAYYFTERYRSNPWPEWMGVLHGDDIFFVFGEPLKRHDNFTDRERALSRQMITYWTNFAKTGSELIHFYAYIGRAPNWSKSRYFRPVSGFGIGHCLTVACRQHCDGGVMDSYIIQMSMVEYYSL